MNSGTNQQIESSKQQGSQDNHQKIKNHEFALTLDQYTIIQHYLPRGYSLSEKKMPGSHFNKRQRGSSYRFTDADNLSKLSAGIDNIQEGEGRSKRNRTKKIDRYLEDEMPKPIKRVAVQKIKKDQQSNPYTKILTALKKNTNSYPFLQPVDPKISGASNYFQIIKDPMDLSTIESNYNSGIYHSLAQFNADIRKIWKNSYLYNDISSKIYKMTVQMQKVHNRLISNIQNHNSRKFSKQKQKGQSKVTTQNTNVPENISRQRQKQYYSNSNNADNVYKITERIDEDQAQEQEREENEYD